MNQQALRRVPVVVALIFNDDGQVLINQRQPYKNFAGMWEFPGGKIEAGETHGAALVRELHEELGLEMQGVVFKHLFHQESTEVLQDKGPTVFILDFYHCTLPKALCPRAMEGQVLAWASPDELANYDFIPSNKALLAQISQLQP